MKNIFQEIEEVKSCIENEPENPNHRYRLGQLYLEINLTFNQDLKLEYLPKARDEFVYALGLDRNNIRAWCSLAQTEHELWLMNREEYPKIKYKGHIEFWKSDNESSELGKLFDSAREEYEETVPNKGIQLAQQIADMVEGRDLMCEELPDVANVMSILGNKKQYEAYIQRAKNTDPTNKEVLEFEATQLENEDRFKESAELYERAVRKDPDDYELRYWFMIALDQAGRNYESCEQGNIRRRIEKERFGEPKKKVGSGSIQIDICKEEGIAKVRRFVDGVEDWSVHEDIPLDQYYEEELG